jgi:two-component system, OmpR family, response regulator TrcR
VLLPTALDSLANRLVGLTAGGDDYMTKPFSLEDGGSRQVWRAGNEIGLTATEFELLRYLMRQPPRAVGRDQILRHDWKYDFGGKSSVFDWYISFLRKKIDAGQEPLIHTVRGAGYMFATSERSNDVTTVSFPPPQG